MSQDDPPGQDSYEARYMKGAGKLLRREKTLWRLHWLLLPFVPLCWGVAAMILMGVGSKPAPPAMAIFPIFTSLILGLSWLLFRTLRVHVTEQKVHIQYGIFGPEIDAASIESCKVVDYDLARFGGWGVRYGVDGSRAYTLAGDSAKVVEINYREGGSSKTVVVSSLDPAALAASIQQAMAAARPRLRAPGAVAEGADADLERDAEALEAAEAAEARQKKR